MPGHYIDPNVQTHGVNYDRTFSPEFEPPRDEQMPQAMPQQHGPAPAFMPQHMYSAAQPAQHPHAPQSGMLGPAFMPPGYMQQAQPYSSIGNPNLGSPYAPDPYTFASPAIPHEGWQGHALAPGNQIDHRDFQAPPENVQPSGKGQSGKFFGMQHPQAWQNGQIGDMRAPQTPFVYGHVATESGENMMGGKWGEGGDDDDEYATPQNTDHNTHGLQPMQPNFHAPAGCSHWSSMHQHCCEGGPPPQPFAQAYRIPSHHSTPRNNQGGNHGGGPGGPQPFAGHPGGNGPTGGYAGGWGFPGPPPGGKGQKGGGGPPPQGYGFGKGGPGGPPQNPKRWLPPPAFNPGSPGSPSLKGWLWQLAAWSRLTSMGWSDRGLAVALSLGGKARELAQTIPHHVLALPTGLSVLLRRIESELGSELQDRTRGAAKVFLQYRRQKGQSSAEYIMQFESRYQTAVDHGLSLSVTMLSMMMLEGCGLSSSQEEWVLGCVGGSYENYTGLRRALRRMPSLDSRHKDSSGWPAWDEDSQDKAWPTNQKSEPEYDPFHNHNKGELNIPPPDAWPAEECEDAESESDDY